MQMKLEPFVARVEIDPNWRLVGQHPATHMPVYEEQRPFWSRHPVLDEDTGKQVWERHPNNNSPQYRVFRLEEENAPFQFTLYDDGRGNVRKERYVEPTASELRERDISLRKHDLMANLVHTLAERNVTPEAFVDRVMGLTGEEGAEEAVAYPLMYAPGRWRLSDQSTMQGNKADAEAAEAVVGANLTS